MRDPNNILEMEKPLSNTIKIDHLPPYSIEDYDLLDLSDYTKFIKDVKNDIRSSYEYRQLMVPFLRNSLHMNRCSFFKNIHNIDTTKIQIHIHHEPLALEDIVHLVVDKRQHFGESMDIFDIGNEVMYLHFIGLVGLIPLSETVHELVHNRYLFVPTDKVFGNYKKLLEFYLPYSQDADLKLKMDRIEEATRQYNAEDAYILRQQSVYVDVTGAYKLPKYEDIAAMMQNRITELNNAPIDNKDDSYFTSNQVIYKTNLNGLLNEEQQAVNKKEPKILNKCPLFIKTSD